jgi:uncharacterized lipoprotein YmbA
MKKNPLKISLAVMTVLSLAVGGCVTKPSPPASFYMVGPLAAVPTGATTEAKVRKTMIAIETVRIPVYLDRNQIVTTLDGTQYYLADFNHWAEPLNDSLTRVVAENLSRMLSGRSVDVFPSAREIPFDYSVNVEVLRLDGQTGGEATLVARWAVFGQDEGELLDLQKTEYLETVADDTYKALVLAYSRLVEHLCRDVAQVLNGTISSP